MATIEESRSQIESARTQLSQPLQISAQQIRARTGGLGETRGISEFRRTEAVGKSRRVGLQKLGIQEQTFERQIARAKPSQAKAQFLNEAFKEARTEIGKKVSALDKRIANEQSRLESYQKQDRDDDSIRDVENDLRQLQKERAVYGGSFGSSDKVSVVKSHFSGETKARADFARRSEQVRQKNVEARRDFRAQSKILEPQLQSAITSLSGTTSKEEYSEIFRDLPAVVRERITSPAQIKFQDTLPNGGLTAFKDSSGKIIYQSIAPDVARAQGLTEIKVDPKTLQQIMPEFLQQPQLPFIPRVSPVQGPFTETFPGVTIPDIGPSLPERGTIVGELPVVGPRISEVVGGYVGPKIERFISRLDAPDIKISPPEGVQWDAREFELAPLMPDAPRMETRMDAGSQFDTSFPVTFPSDRVQPHFVETYPDLGFPDIGQPLPERGTITDVGFVAPDFKVADSFIRKDDRIITLTPEVTKEVFEPFGVKEPVPFSVLQPLSIPSKVVRFGAEKAGQAAEFSFSKVFPEGYRGPFYPEGEVITAKQYGKGVEIATGLGAYLVPGAVAPLLISEVASATETFKRPEAEAERIYRQASEDYRKQPLEEGEVHLTEEELRAILLPQITADLKVGAVTEGVVATAFLGLGGAIITGKAIKGAFGKKYLRMSPKTYEKWLKKIQKQEVDAYKASKEVFDIQKDSQKFTGGGKSEFGTLKGEPGISTEVIGQVEITTIADDLFNLKVFKTKKEAVSFVKGMDKVKTSGGPHIQEIKLGDDLFKQEDILFQAGRKKLGLSPYEAELKTLDPLSSAFRAKQDSFTVSESFKNAQGTSIIQYTYNLGAKGKPINLGLQIVKIPSKSSFAEIKIFKKGRRTDKLTDIEPYILEEKLVADIGKAQIAKIDKDFIRLTDLKFRKVPFEKARDPYFDLLKDFRNIPSKTNLKDLYGKGIHVEKQRVLERITPKGITPRIDIGIKEKSVGVGAQIIKKQEVRIRGVGTSEKTLAPFTFKFGKDPSKKTPFSRTFGEVTPKKDVLGKDIIPEEGFLKQVQVPKEILEKAPVIIPTIAKVPRAPILPKAPKVIPKPTVGVGKPFMVGGLGLTELRAPSVDAVISEVKVSGVLPPPAVAPPITGEVSAIPIPTVTPLGAFIEAPRFKEELKIDQVPGVKLREIQQPVLKPITTQVPSLDLRVGQVPRVQPREAQVPRVVPKAISQVEQVPRVATGLGIALSLRPPRPRPPRPKPKPKLKPKFKKRLIIGAKPIAQQQGYGVEIKRRGQWQRAQLPYSFATKEGAQAFAMTKLRGEAAASARLVKSKKPVRATGRRPSALQQVMFRKGKGKDVIVQKKLLRITTAGEVRQISAVGAEARRRQARASPFALSPTPTLPRAPVKKKKKATKKKSKKKGKK